MTSNYSNIEEEMISCPYCGCKKIKYLVTSSNKSSANPRYAAQCFCNYCKATGPRVLFTPSRISEDRSLIDLAKEDFVAKEKAILLWNTRGDLKDQSLALSIKRFRKSFDLNQAEFGKLFGVDSGTVSAWESGRNVMRNSSLNLFKILLTNPEMLEKIKEN